MLKIVVTIVSLLIATEAIADDKRIVSGVGVSTCKEFLEIVSAESTPAILVFFSWAQGFMAAQNIDKYKTNKTYRSIDGTIELQQEFLRQYCKGYPDNYFSNAVQKMYESFPLKTLK